MQSEDDFSRKEIEAKYTINKRRSEIGRSFNLVNTGC
jgi:hypothetical protein